MQNATKRQKEAEEEALAANVREADLKQLLAQLAADFQTLEGLAGGDAETARQTALDMKWIRERQMILSLGLGCYFFCDGYLHKK